jgi:ABC-type polar amino acid transport system ATPase subunit
MAFLEMRQVEKNFGAIHVLRGLDLLVNEHQVVCLIGPSGCGKSTLLRCINGLESIQGGEIRLEDVASRGRASILIGSDAKSASCSELISFIYQSSECRGAAQGAGHRVMKRKPAPCGS